MSTAIEASTAALDLLQPKLLSPAPRTAPPGWQPPRKGIVSNYATVLASQCDESLKGIGPSRLRVNKVPVLLGDGIFGPRRQAFVALQRLVGEFDGLFQLRVMSADDQVGPLLHFVVGIDAAILYDPLAAVIG